MCYNCIKFLPISKLEKLNFEGFENSKLNENGDGISTTKKHDETKKIVSESDAGTESKTGPKTIAKTNSKIESRSSTEKRPKCGFSCDLKSWGAAFPCNLYDFTKPDRFSRSRIQRSKSSRI